MLAAIHEVLERHQVTEEEWFGALAFLGEVAKADELILLLRRDAHLGADRRAVARRRGSGATASDVEGPMYTVEPPFRKKIYEEYEGISGDDDLLFVRGPRDLDRRIAAARRGRRRLADRSGRRLRRLGRAAAGGQLPRPHQGRGRTARTSSRRCSRSRTRCRPPGPVGRASGGDRPAPVAAAHIHFKVTAPGHSRSSRRSSSRATRTWRTTPSARSSRASCGRSSRRTATSRAGSTSRWPAVSLTFDNLGEVADLERGSGRRTRRWAGTRRSRARCRGSSRCSVGGGVARRSSSKG